MIEMKVHLWWRILINGIKENRFHWDTKYGTEFLFSSSINSKTLLTIPFDIFELIHFPFLILFMEVDESLL